MASGGRYGSDPWPGALSPSPIVRTDSLTWNPDSCTLVKSLLVLMTILSSFMSL